MSLAMPGVDPRLAAIVGAAANDLGYDVRATSGREGRTNPASFHSRGMAQDFQIYDPQGNPIPNKGEDTTGMYARLAHQAFTRQQQMYPELNGKLAWGGAFGTQIGGGGPPDLMHFDLGGERGTAYPQFRQQALAARFGGAAPFVAGGSAATPTGPDNRQVVFDKLIGLGLNPKQALGVLWGLGGESYSTLKTTAYNPNDPGGAIGIGQWIGPRRAALESYAAQQGKPVSDINVQAGHLGNELTGAYSNVLAALKNAQTPEEATRIWVSQYERPKFDNSDKRIAAGSHVGSLDAQGHFVPGDPAESGGTGVAGGGPRLVAGRGGGPAYPYVPPMTPEQYMGQSIGHALANLSFGGSGGGGGSSGGLEMTAADQPAIRMPGLDVQITNTPSPFPAEYQPGGASIGAQLGQLGASPATNPLDPSSMSITGGAPSMTAMLPTIGMTDQYNYGDPRATRSPSLSMRSPRIG